MKRKRNPQVEDLVQFPCYEFAPFRSGWNGWIFRVGMIEKLYVSKSGLNCAKVRYCARPASRYQLLPCEEATKNLRVEHLFEWNDLQRKQEWYEHRLQLESEGEEVCADQDMAFLLNHGYIN